MLKTSLNGEFLIELAHPQTCLLTLTETIPPEKEKQLRFLNFTLGSLLRTQGVFSTPWKSGYFPEKRLSMRHTGLASHASSSE